MGGKMVTIENLYFTINGSATNSTVMEYQKKNNLNKSLITLNTKG